MDEERNSPLIAAKVSAALAEDARCRHKGVTDGLYRFPEDIAPFQRLGPGVDIPCILPGEKIFDRVKNASEFGKLLERRGGRMFSGFDFAAHGLCMAGGAVSALANRGTAVYASAFDDYDFFLVGHDSDAAAVRAINEFAEHLAAYWKGMYVYRTKQCVTFVSEHGDEHEKPVQVILRRYSTIAEVIHGFDLGSSAFLWDGSALWTTALGKLAAEHAVNVLNLPARRGSYERRLVRYFERGFGLVLPDLDVEKFRTLGSDTLPFLRLATCYTRGAGEPAIDAGALRLPRAHTDVSPSDYMSLVITYGNPEAALPLNLRALAAEGVPLCAAAEWTPGMDVTQVQPTYSAAALTRYVRDCFTPQTVHTKKLYAVLGATIAGEIMRDHLLRIGLPGAPACDISLIAAHAEAIVRSAAEKGAALPFALMSVEENTALTGPFPRATITPEEWYGPVFRQPGK